MIMKSNNQINIPEAKAGMEQFKMQAANEVGVNLQNGYNGNLTSREAGPAGIFQFHPPVYHIPKIPFLDPLRRFWSLS